MLFGDVGADDAVQNHVGQPLHHALVFVGLTRRILLVHLRGGQEEGQHENADEENAEGVLGEGDVEGPR